MLELNSHYTLTGSLRIKFARMLPKQFQAYVQALLPYAAFRLLLLLLIDAA